MAVPAVPIINGIKNLAGTQIQK